MRSGTGIRSGAESNSAGTWAAPGGTLGEGRRGPCAGTRICKPVQVCAPRTSIILGQRFAVGCLDLAVIDQRVEKHVELTQILPAVAGVRCIEQHESLA